MAEKKHTRSIGAGHTKEAGSAHYQAMKIQPIDYIEANQLGFHEGNVIKYVTRWRRVDGLKDLEKAEWYVQRLIEKAKEEEATYPMQIVEPPPMITISPQEYQRTQSQLAILVTALEEMSDDHIEDMSWQEIQKLAQKALEKFKVAL